MEDYDDRIRMIDIKIAALYEFKGEVRAEKQAACEHTWQKELLHYRALYCPKCMATDYTDACSRIGWPVGAEWPYECDPRDFCWKHKQPAVECVV